MGAEVPPPAATALLTLRPDVTRPCRKKRTLRSAVGNAVPTSPVPARLHVKGVGRTRGPELSSGVLDRTG